MVNPPENVSRGTPLCDTLSRALYACRAQSIKSGSKPPITPGQSGCVTHVAVGVRRATCTPSIGRVRQERSPVREAARALSRPAPLSLMKKRDAR